MEEIMTTIYLNFVKLSSIPFPEKKGLDLFVYSWGIKSQRMWSYGRVHVSSIYSHFKQIFITGIPTYK